MEKQEASLEEVLQAEAALLASDLENLEAEGAEPEFLEELEAGVENAAEALVFMLEARNKINEMKRDHGYGRSSSGGDRSSKPHGNQVNRATSTSTCFDCGLPGQWKGDKECFKPGAGLGRKDAKRGGGKQVMISESMNTECLIPSSLSPDEHAEPHEVHAHVPLNASLSEALASSQMANAPAGKAPQLELSIERCNIPEKPHGFRDGIHGGPLACGHAGGTRFRRYLPQDPICGADGSQRGGQEGERRGEATDCRARAGRTTRRTSNLSPRPSETISPLSLGCQREGYQCNVARKCGPFDGKHAEKCQSQSRGEKFKQILSRASTSSTGKRTCSGMARSSSYSARTSCSIPLQHVQRLMAEQEAKFQGVLSQLFQHVMAMQNNQMMPSLSSGPPDASMEN